MYSEMIFQRGYIHCDPHAGNVLVRSKKEGGRGRGGRGDVEVVLLDHGLYTVKLPTARVCLSSPCVVTASVHLTDTE